MVIVTLTKCPPKLRGDLSKWFIEINTGVYCGNVNQRIREAVWQRICENIGDGKATMVFSTNNEQGFDFKVYNSDWEPMDYDGIKLMIRPNKRKEKAYDSKKQFSKNEIRKIISKSARQKMIDYDIHDYCVIDIETTGLNVAECHILEIAALKIRDSKISDQFETLVCSVDKIPSKITQLTGINIEDLCEKGESPKDALIKFMKFIHNDICVGHNIAFDAEVIENHLEELKLRPFRNKKIDTLRIARQKLENIDNYKLSYLAKLLKTDHLPTHRAMNDCMAIYDVFCKLNKRDGI